MTKILSQLLPSFTHCVVSADMQKIDDLTETNKIPISNLVFDSREVTKNSLFFALPGTHTDGNNFIAQAILNGANAIVFQGELNHNQQTEVAKAIIKRTLDNTLENENQKFAPALIKVDDARFCMAPISACFYDNPSERLIVIGVTGTEGKSSTVSFIWQLLRECGQKAGFISTVEYSFGQDALPNPQHQTTPEAPIIQHHLNEMLLNGCKYAVVETSSHGLSKKLNRCGNIAFDCGIFMNVTLEHLEFHKTFENYRNDKANLFRALDKFSHTKIIGGEKTKITPFGIVNLEDSSADFFAECTNSEVFGFTSNALAGKGVVLEQKITLPPIPKKIKKYFIASDIHSDDKSLNFKMESNTKDFETEISSKLPGSFNAYNIMAAIIAVSNLTNITMEKVASFVPNLTPIKGRMTEIVEGQPFELIVDYAHTPSSFEIIFPPIRNRCKGKIFALFGSGGERDLTKRPLQGQIAAKYCDVIVLADEDPRGENPTELLQMIAVGAEKEGKILGKDLFIIPDRPTAIRKTFSMAKQGDVVLLLGKAHENSIIYKDKVMPYDEISEAKKALKELKNDEMWRLSLSKSLD